MRGMSAITTETMAALRDSHQDCFACGTCNKRGLGLRFEVDSDGLAKAIWQPLEGLGSYPDRIHGGVIATLLDCAMVHALFASGIAGVTVEMTIRYLRGVGLLEPLHVTGRVVSESHGLFICRADVHQGGIHAVRASAKFMSLAPTTTRTPDDGGV